MLFHLKHMMFGSSVGLVDALGFVGEAFIGRQHDASVDAYNCSVLLNRLLKDKV